MKKFFCFLLVLLFFVPAQQVSADTYMHLTGDTYARVLQVIGGEALRVQPVNTNQVALVRLAGISTMGRREAQDFMTRAVQGRTVQLVLSAATAPNDRFNDRWVPIYLTYDNVVYNRALVQRGLAWVDPAYQHHWMYNLLISDAHRAASARIGIWEDEGFRTQYSPIRRRRRRGEYWEDMVNINTASASQINNILYDVDSWVGSEIVRSRNVYGPFRHVDDTLGILTREEFDENWDRMKVSTNINTATEAELAQLINVNTAAAREIARFRDRHWFNSIYQLVEEELLTEYTFERNRPFISTDYVDEIDYDYWHWDRNFRLYVNDATVSQWMNLPGRMPRYFAEELVWEARRRPFRTWGELRDFFYDFGYEDLYHRIQRFLVLR